MEQRDAIRLRDRPHESGGRGQGPEQRDDARGGGSLSWCVEFGDELCVQGILLQSSSGTRLRTPCPQAYAGAGGGLTSNARPNRLRGVTSSASVVRGAGSDSVARS